MTRVAKRLIMVNAVIVGALIVFAGMRIDVSARSWLDIPAFGLVWYAVLLLPATTIVSALVLARGRWLRMTGAAVAVGGTLYLLALHSIFLEGHVTAVRVYGPDGRLQIDSSGKPVYKPNPDYVEFVERQRHRSAVALAMIAAGSVALAIDRSRKPRPA